MRILVVVHGFPPAALGGSEIYAQAHARALRAHGDEVCVFTRDRDSSRAEYDLRVEHRDGLRVVSVNNTFRNTRAFEETYRNDVIGAVAERLIDEFRPDAAHIHHLTCLSTTIVRSLAERRVPCFMTLHDYWLICHRGQLLDTDYRVCEGPEPFGCHACVGAAGGANLAGLYAAPALRALERRLPVAAAHVLRGAAGRLNAVASTTAEAERHARRRLDHMREVCSEVTHFLAPSVTVRDRFVRFGVAPDRISLVPHGIDRTCLPRVARSTSPRLRLGFLGSLMVSKAPHVLLEAAARLPASAATVDLFGAYSPYHGDDSYWQQLEPLLKRDGVRAHGAIARDGIAQALASIDVLVVPSIWPETSSLVIQEAFLAGVPVVASRIGAIPELVEDGRNGLLFRAGDVDDLARLLLRFLREPGLLEALRRGIPPVRSIDDDVRVARRLYRTHVQNRRESATRVAAVVLNYRTPDDTFLAVKSLLSSQTPCHDVIVVNNDNIENARDILQNVSPAISYLHTGRNLGFSGGMNVGIREALARGADAVLLANSDVIVPPNCLTRLQQALETHPEAGIAGPVVLARSEPGRVASLGMSYQPRSGRMRHRAYGARFESSGFGGFVGFGRFGRFGGFATAPPPGGAVDGVSGCLMLVKREVFEAIGLLDEDYFFSFEDLDFCLKARRAGFATVLAGSATVYHEGSRSMGPDTPRRLYFAVRNHLLLARRSDPAAGRFSSLSRAASIVMLNLAHAVRATGGSLPARLRAVARGTRDYAVGRFGADA